MEELEVPPVPVSPDQNGPDVEEFKNLFKSKTFWWNVLTIAAELSQILPLPPGTVAIISSVVNIGLRILTTEPVKVVPDALKSKGTD